MSERRTIHTGRNLPVALAVGLALGGLVILTLLTVKVTFLVLVAALAGVGLWELRAALGSRQIKLPLVPVAIGGVVMVAVAYHWGLQATLGVLVVTFIAVLAWRLPGGADGYVRDITAGVFTLVYVPAMAATVALMLAEPNGQYRVLLFVILAVCCDSGGYFAGILFGRHLMAPTISPKKTWEGLAGSVLTCLAAGGLGMTLMLHGSWWSGLILGAAAAGAAILGDLVESTIKRELDTKDMSSILPGHGGAMERLDSLLIVAPVSWLLMSIFLPS